MPKHINSKPYWLRINSLRYGKHGIRGLDTLTLGKKMYEDARKDPVYEDIEGVDAETKVMDSGITTTSIFNLVSRNGESGIRLLERYIGLLDTINTEHIRDMFVDDDIILEIINKLVDSREDINIVIRSIRSNIPITSRRADDNDYHKYLKYKRKYLELKKSINLFT